MNIYEGCPTYIFPVRLLQSFELIESVALLLVPCILTETGQINDGSE